MLFALASLALLAPSVIAHGWLSTISIDGTTYTGPSPDDAPTKDTVIRQVSDVGPVKGATNPDMVCGLSASLANKQATAMPGSKIDFMWISRGPQNWIHKVGPVMTYLAECTGTPDCSTFDASKAQWMKIDQLGLSDAASGTWWHQNFFDGKPLSVTLPSDLKAGNYLFRNEIIALHTATSEGGAEFYPACAQLSVGGTQTGTPNATVTIPGVYSDTDAGILTPDIFNTPVQYIFPGGAVSSMSAEADSADLADLKAETTLPAVAFNVLSGSSNSSSSDSSSVASSAASATSGTASPTAVAGAASAASTTAAASKSCKAKTTSQKKRRVHARHWFH
ncbi:lytic polysaccharide monooxygenase [Peniophora sp. CONT]|nr:lytic polysaccharide monooxygenase [Peniophora sp. CONT]